MNIFEPAEYFNLIISGGLSGQANMDLDSRLLERYAKPDDFSSRPTLRIYYFSPPALSLGFFQKEGQPNGNVVQNAIDKGFDVVRRPTGGRAVLHKDEITYAVIASYKTGIFAGKLMETYRKIGSFLFRFFEKLRLSPDANSLPDTGSGVKGISGGQQAGSFNCFLKAHSYEITFDGKKICGNAQRRSGSAFLQHGSIYTDYRPPEHMEVFEPGAMDREYFDNITGIKQEMERAGITGDLSFKGLSAVLAESFGEVFNLKPLPAAGPF